MDIGSAFSVSQDAMAADMVRMSQIASNIANDDGSDVDNLIENMTEMQVIKSNYEANGSTISTMNDLLENILGMV
ncbi:MAG: hypothetical protein A2020_13310 [Lentisphaerae bacterium GWF2_45_14]|nr:MAG: hypothetical protein A2020_13310 [Lentisphaerae bacterium GWF2_45_14]